METTQISHIEYPTRAALVAALSEIRGSEGVTHVDIVDLGRTLRVVHRGDSLEAPDPVKKSKRARATEAEPEPDAESDVQVTEDEDVL